ncbi:MAG: uracil-DNA glycosylase [Thermoplasmata archaeon]|nr:uracil-DNA glycosylase [Thermoplasmata archaeon]MCI4358960.1 uracil-DNA glycosylase [Thermoplasmata archaeon]
MNESLEAIRREVVVCERCPRLVRYRTQVASEKKREFRNDEYWGRPVPGFGDPNAPLVIVGLAPAAHGSNRTGRVFTGDRSAGFLVRGLFDAGFANQPTSVRRGDGLHYSGVYVTAAVRCAPPDNRPTPEEEERCRPFLEREFRALTRARAYLALGGFAWEATLRCAASTFGVERPRVPFAHGIAVSFGPSRPMLWASYHPSPQNTNTGKLTAAMFLGLLRQIRGSWEGAYRPESAPSP